MGKGALITAVAVVFSTLLMLFNSQMQSNETDNRENSARSAQMARELALVGRKLVLTGWVANDGSGGAAPFSDTLSRNGGKIWIDPSSWSNSGNDTLDFRVLASYDSVVHEIRSRYAWHGYALNPMQLKVGALQPTISPLANLDVDGIALDDQSLEDLSSVLVDDLNLISDLSDYGLGLTETHDALHDELDLNGFYDLANSISLFTQTERDALDGQPGIFYPDQISEAVDAFALAFPSLNQVVPDASSLGSSFGINDSYAMLTIEGNTTLNNDLHGQGVLVIEGDFVVPEGVTFVWEGVILVKPPQSSMSPVIDLSGNVNIQGALVALHDGLPNTGHMDVSVMRDVNGIWSSAFGAESVDQDILRHTHDFTSAHGNRVVFLSDNPMDPAHEFEARMNETLGLISPSDSIFFEIYNHTQNGGGLVVLDRAFDSLYVQHAGIGFDAAIADAGNAYRSIVFDRSEIDHLDIAVTRLSGLKKMWDNGLAYPGCTHYADQSQGPLCVWAAYNRFYAMTLRMYSTNYISGDKLVYEASMYWHRRQDEEADFNQEMSDLATAIQDPDYGMDLIIGDNAAIHGDVNTVLNLPAFSSITASIGVDNLGTWHRQWAANDPANPLRQSPY